MQVVRTDLVYFPRLGLRVPHLEFDRLAKSRHARARQARRVLANCPVARAKSRTAGLTTVLIRLFPLLGAKDPWPPADPASSTRHRLLSGGKTRH
jgi:hypothetical protein